MAYPQDLRQCLLQQDIQVLFNTTDSLKGTSINIKTPYQTVSTMYKFDPSGYWIKLSITLPRSHFHSEDQYSEALLI